MRQFCLCLVLATTAVSAAAAVHSDEIPAPEDVLGYQLGQWVTSYHGMELYLSRLAEASPRVAFGSYGEDYEHHQLRFAVVSSPSNLERLDEIRTATARLADPRGLDSSQIDSLIETTPLVIWLNYSTDGNETAGLESALMMAHHLAADTSAATTELLDKAVVVITPIMNPSSHERWASWSNSFASRGGNPDPLALEHNPPWAVLTNNNHYLTDLNRESLWATQRESAAMLDLFYQWHPAIFVDHHGEYDDFAGPGYQEPLNPLITESQRAWLDRLGRVIGQRFAERAWSYSPWETGSFYPGYWESLGLLNGAIGFTYETIGGGSKGLRYRRPDGSVITLQLAAQQHFQASLSVIEEATAAREELLEDYAAYFRTAVDLASSVPEQAFLLPPDGDPARRREVLRILLTNRVEVLQTTRDTTAREIHDYFGHRWGEKALAAGTYVIPVNQPQSRLLLTLLRKDLELPRVTLEAAQEFRAKQETAGYYNPNVGITSYLFYDVTAWSLPLTHNLPAYWVEVPVGGELGPLTTVPAPEPEVPTTVPRYGYLFPESGNASAALLAGLLQSGIIVNVAWGELEIHDRVFPRGSILVRNERNLGRDLLTELSAAARKHGVDLVGIDSTYADRGPSVGSDQFVWIRPPRIAVLTGDPVSPSSYGNLWFVLEDLFEVEFTPIESARLDAPSLEGYDVLVLPDGWYDRETFTAEWIATVKVWIANGGTLVCLKGASRWATDPEIAIASTRRRGLDWSTDPNSEGTTRQAQSIPGAILRTSTHPYHFLTLGNEGELPVLVRSNLAFESDPAVASVLRFAAKQDLRLAGFAYADSLERLAETPYLIEESVGEGHVVLFLDDPNFRVYWRGLSRFFLNSLLLTPSF